MPKGAIMAETENDLEVEQQPGDSEPGSRNFQQTTGEQTPKVHKRTRPESWQGRVKSKVRAMGYEAGQAALSPATTMLSPRNAPPHGKMPESPDFGGEVCEAGLLPRVLNVEQETCGPQTGGDLEYESARARLHQWIEQGARGPKHVQAPTGIGGFQVLYDPRTGTEFVRISAAIDFVDTIVMKDGKAVAMHEKAIDITKQINRKIKDEKKKEAAIAEWQWGDNDQRAFEKKLKQVVEEFWGFSTVFHCTRRFWEDLGARPVLDIAVHPGKKGPEDHLSITVYKVPEHVSFNVGALYPGEGPHNNRMTLASNDVNPRKDNLLEVGLAFEPDSAEVSEALLGQLAMLAKRFKPGSKNPPLMTFKVCGATEGLARQRYFAMSGALSAGNIGLSRLHFEYGGKGDTVTVVVGGGGAQTVASHEFGHQLGLNDEYAIDEGSGLSGTGKPAGQVCGHDDLAKSVGLPGCVHENNDSVMSMGRVFRRGHAAVY